MKENNSKIKILDQTVANKIAAVFDEYMLYRPELICGWWESNDKTAESIKKLAPQIRWQPVLLSLLKRKIISEQYFYLFRVDYLYI